MKTETGWKKKTKEKMVLTYSCPMGKNPKSNKKWAKESPRDKLKTNRNKPENHKVQIGNTGNTLRLENRHRSTGDTWTKNRRTNKE